MSQPPPPVSTLARLLHNQKLAWVLLGRKVGMGFACVATSVPGPELAWVLHGCNKCAMSKVGMGFAGVATSVPALVLAWWLLKRKTG